MSVNGMSRRSVVGAAVGLGVVAGAAAMPVGEAAAAERASSAAGRRPDPRTVLITGCSSGFGYLTAMTLARSGHRVFASMRNTRTANAGVARELLSLARDEDLAIEVVDIDITDERSVERGVEFVQRRARRIDVLFNNAGVFSPAVLETLTIEDLKKSFDTNLFGHLRMNRAVLPAMREHGEGLVIQMSTALGRFVLPFMGPYVGAKWALEGVTESLRYELAPFGVEVVVVEPGGYVTEFLEPNGRRYYREYLQGLSRQDAHRRRQYGELAERPEFHLEPGGASTNPQEIADAVASVVRTPHGQRPLRLVGPGMEFLADINEGAQEISRMVMEQDGWGDLLEIAPRP
ncbi:SDR family oxidoreductase [Streptomyces sp. MP131-18]|uniref:SDR family oxidoreductase n=1 Tax=Streptomyces sp. MP131-18 TaxID=1857892 RepID=UPI001180882B|nr:SDR family oxidoreductase [Streptomyces sp. MP131-18]